MISKGVLPGALAKRETYKHVILAKKCSSKDLLDS